MHSAAAVLDIPDELEQLRLVAEALERYTEAAEALAAEDPHAQLPHLLWAPPAARAAGVPPEEARAQLRRAQKLLEASEASARRHAAAAAGADARAEERVTAFNEKRDSALAAFEATLGAAGFAVARRVRPAVCCCARFLSVLRAFSGDFFSRFFRCAAVIALG